MSKKSILLVFIFILLAGLLISAAFFFYPWQNNENPASDLPAASPNSASSSSVSSSSVSSSSASSSPSSSVSSLTPPPDFSENSNSVGILGNTYHQNMMYVYEGKKHYSTYPNGSAAVIVRNKSAENKSYEEVCTFL
ncbi:hypothetical protein [Methanolapillus ohkumae]|uniref:hypothetical protein n=1 Tax=Methanolapillus ohkumae TaxID=3028298 RepID=UPI0030B9129F